MADVIELLKAPFKPTYKLAKATGIGEWLGNTLASSIGDKRLTAGLNTSDKAKKRSAGYYGEKPGESSGSDILAGVLASAARESDLPGSNLLATAGDLAIETGESGRQMTKALAESDLYGEDFTRDVLEAIATVAYPQSAGDVAMIGMPIIGTGLSKAPKLASATGQGFRRANDLTKFASTEDLAPIIRNWMQGKTSDGLLKAGRVSDDLLGRVKAGPRQGTGQATGQATNTSKIGSTTAAADDIPIKPTKNIQKAANKIRKEEDPAKFMKEPVRYMREHPIRTAATVATTAGIPLVDALTGGANSGGSVTPEQAAAFLEDAARRDAARQNAGNGNQQPPAAPPVVEPPTSAPAAQSANGSNNIVNQLMEAYQKMQAANEPNALEKIGNTLTSTGVALNGGDPRAQERLAALPNRTPEQQAMLNIIPQLAAFQAMNAAQQEMPLSAMDQARLEQIYSKIAESQAIANAQETWANQFK